MSSRFPPPRTYIAAAAAILLMGGCAGDELTDSIRPTMADRNAKGSAKVAAIMRVGESTAAAGDLATAVGLYRRAHEMDPNLVTPLVKLGQTLAALGSFEQAAEAFRSAISLSGSSPDTKTDGAPEAAHGLGNALVTMNQPRAAVTQYEHAMMIRDDPRTYGGIGVAYDMLGQHGAAQAYYRTGLEAYPSNLNLLNNLGISLSVTGRYDEAVEVLKKAVAQPKSNGRTRLNLALAYGLAGKSDEAAAIARRDLDETSVQRNLAYYETLRGIRNKKSLIKAIGAHVNGFYVDPDRPAVLSKGQRQGRLRSGSR